MAACTNDVRELASLGRALALLREVRALADMLLVAIEALLAVAKHRKVAADPLSRPDADVRERAIRTCATPVVGEVHAKWRALRRRIVRERAGFGGVRAGALQEGPADGDLGGIVLVHAREATVARSCVGQRGRVCIG